jgi:hypothetical protein
MSKDNNSNLLWLAFFFAYFVSTVCLALVFFSPGGGAIDASQLNPYIVHFGEGVNTALQRKGHLISVVLCAVFVLLAALLRPISNLAMFQSNKIWLVRIFGFALAAYFYFTCYWWWQELSSLIVGLIGLLLIVLYRNQLKSGRALHEYKFVLLALLLIFSLPGLFAPLDLSAHSIDDFIRIQAHYNHVVVQGDRLAVGHKLFADVIPEYGAFLPVLSGGWQKYIGAYDLGAYVAQIRILQFVFLILAWFLYSRYSFGLKLGSCLATAFLIPWYHFNQLGLYYPNNSAWRSIGLPIGLIVLYQLRGAKLNKAAFSIGAVSCFLMLLNFELGLATSLGMFAYLYFRYQLLSLKSFGDLFKAAVLLALGFISGLAAFSVLSLLLLGYVPNYALCQAVWQTAMLVASTGYSGIKGSFNPVAGLIFFHAVFVLFSTAFKANCPLSFRRSFKAAVAVIIVIWFAYYANRAHPWNLVTFYFLYGFFLIDLVQDFLHKTSKSLPLNIFAISGACALGLILLPQIASSYTFMMPYYVNGLSVMLRGPAKKPARKVCGVYMQSSVADELEAKAKFIKEKKARTATAPMFFTDNAFFIPKLANSYSPLPFRDTFAEVLTKKDYARLLDAVIASKAPYIYFDSASSKVSGSKGWKDYYAQLRQDLSSHYTKIGEESGWEIWQLSQ